MAEIPVGQRRPGKLRRTPRNDPNNTNWRPWKEALSRAVHREDPQSKQKFLDLIAQRVILAALQGDMAAVREIGDRLDGRAITLQGDPDNPMTLVGRIESIVIDKVTDIKEGAAACGSNSTKH